MARLLWVVLLLAPWASSCVAVAAATVVGAGLIQYGRNQVEQDFPVDLDRAWEATLEGLRRLALVPSASALTRTEGRVECDDVSVLVERHPEGFTRVRVRVGAFHTSDHERRARLILQEVVAAVTSQDELRAWVQRVNEPGPPKSPP